MYTAVNKTAVICANSDVTLDDGRTDGRNVKIVLEFWKQNSQKNTLLVADGFPVARRLNTTQGITLAVLLWSVSSVVHRCMYDPEIALSVLNWCLKRLKTK